MENLLQIKDLFPMKVKSQSTDSKTNNWLKAQTSSENKFKDFSKALKQQSNSHEESSYNLKDSTDKNLIPTNKTFKQDKNLSNELEKNADQPLFSDHHFENLDENAEVNSSIPLENLNDLCDDNFDLDVEDEKTLWNPVLKDEVKDREVVSPKAFISNKEAVVEHDEDQESEEDRKTNVFAEAVDMPIIVENRQILPEIKPENFSQENEISPINDENISDKLEVINEDFQKVAKNKAHVENFSAKISMKPGLEPMVSDPVYLAQKSSDIGDKSVQPKNLEFLRTIGTNSALNEDKIKVGIVSTKQINSFNVGNSPKHKTLEQNVQQALETSSHETTEYRVSSSRQDTLTFKQDENTVAPKAIIQKYDEVRENYTDTASNVIAAISEQMDELKRIRRNSLNVKIDLENGESLNCQLIVSKENLNVRFPSMAEAFKTQILEHWHQLKQFAEERNFNLSTPYFANPLS